MSASGRDLVVGASGFLGRHLVRKLEADGREVTPISRHHGDLTDANVTNALFRDAPRAERIFHVVTHQRTGASQYQIQGKLLAINTRIHLSVLEAWRTCQPQAKLISTGSSCTYPESTRPLIEQQFGLGPVHPSVYGYALAKQTLATGSAAYSQQYGLRFLHCVLATMYGPGDHKASDRSHFVGALLERAVSEKRSGAGSFSVWGDPNTVREILYVSDQIDAILAADAAFENEILNCAANASTTVGHVASEILKALDWTVPFRRPDTSFQGVGYKVLDSTRFLSRTHWSPAITLADGLRRVIASEHAS